MENMVIARFKDNETAAETYRLRQWDYGQTLRIEGLSLPDMVEVHFSIRDVGGDAERQIGTTKGGVTEVSIPNKMLENKHCKCSEYTIYAWVYLSDETSGQTEYDIRIPVETRSRPVNFAPPNQPDFAGQVMEKLNDVEMLKTDFDGLKKESDERDKQKLTRPESAKVGQIFRVQAVNEDGTLTLESIDMPKCDVTDVTIDGQSIVSKGVAEIPIATGSISSESKMGAVKTDPKLGIRSTDIGKLAINFAGEKEIKARGTTDYKPITSTIIDYAVKAAMCDGKGEAWTAEEQAAARERMGCYNGYTVLMDAVIEEEANMIYFTLPNNTVEFIAYFDFYDTEVVINQAPYLVFDNKGNVNPIKSIYSYFGTELKVGDTNIKGIQKCVILNDEDVCVEYSALSINQESTNQSRNRAGRVAIAKRTSNSIRFIVTAGSYPIGTRFLVLVRCQ